MSIERARSISIAVLLLYSFRAQIVICASRTQIVPMYRGPQRHVSNAVLLRVPFSFSVSSSLMSSVFYPAPWILYLIPGRASSGSGIWEAPPARCTSSPRSPLLSVSVSVSASASAPMSESVPADESTFIPGEGGELEEGRLGEDDPRKRRPALSTGRQNPVPDNPCTRIRTRIRIRIIAEASPPPAPLRTADSPPSRASTSCWRFEACRNQRFTDRCGLAHWISTHGDASNEARTRAGTQTQPRFCFRFCCTPGSPEGRFCARATVAAARAGRAHARAIRCILPRRPGAPGWTRIRNRSVSGKP